MRQIVLDTETTGLEPSQGHRIIEIGCVELVNRRLTGNHFHQYLQPDRDIDPGAQQVHGISSEFLADKPRFAEIVDELLDYLRGAELIIHNAPFDMGFLRHELQLAGHPADTLDTSCQVTDTLVMARQMHPAQKNNLDALCRRYEIDNSQRELHGALLDAEILAEVYLVMTGGQRSLLLSDDESDDEQVTGIRRLPAERPRLRVIQASDEEERRHQQCLANIDKVSRDGCLWSRQQESSSRSADLCEQE